MENTILIGLVLALVTQSKYNDIPGFNEWSERHRLLLEHGNEISFRNLKICELPAN